MFNLLPKSFKDEIKSEYKRRRLILTLVLIIFLQISALVFIFPSWSESVSREQETISEIEGINQSLSSKDASPIASIISETNLKLNIINATMQYPEFLPFLDLVLSNKSSLVHVNSISFTTVSTSTANISLSGVSGTREALVAFAKSLENTKSFKKVNLPVSNLAKDKNISFSITMTFSK
ncbi:MAG: PilN domain-containing protein, partial [Nitrospira sp.]